MERQQNAPIQVIVGNPPWSAGQRSAGDDNPNVDYPELEQRVADTYAARSTATNKNSLYDTYKMAIRWASDRIGEQGVIALVTNGSWIDGNVDSGVRACLAEEFSSVWVLNLRGNARTSGELRRSEGDNIFGQGSRAPVAVTVLVRNPDADHEGCRIRYRDVGDYLSRDEKFVVLKDARSLAGIADWREIEPDEHDDWIGQRDPAFRKLFPVGSKAVKAGKSGEAVFRLFSNGYKTGRDGWLYNFSPDVCAETGQLMVEDYLGALELREKRPDLTVDEAAGRNSGILRWDRELKSSLRRGKGTTYSEGEVRVVQYRPFVKQHLYGDLLFAQRKYLQDRIFPPSTETGTDIDHPSIRPSIHPSIRPSIGQSVNRPVNQWANPSISPNRTICVPGVGSTKPWSVLVTDVMPDLELVSKGQCFPRYRYERRIASSASRGRAPTSRSRSSSPTACPTSTSSSSASASRAGRSRRRGGVFNEAGGALFETELQRVDNITDTALRAFRVRYGDSAITKDAIFDYVYGVLHSPVWRERFKNDLTKDLPRIPFADDFHAFAETGASLAELHLGYETCREYPLELRFAGEGEPGPEHFRLGTRAMKLEEGGAVLRVNEHVRLTGIPADAHRYQVNGRTPLGWFIDRYKVTRDKRSGIVNDPNSWFEDPRDLIAAVCRIVHVSVETVRILRDLPALEL